MSATAITAALVLSTSPAAVADEELPGPASRPAAPVERSGEEQGRQALRAVKSAFEGEDEGTKGGADLTLLLRDLRANLEELSPSQRAVAERYLARPDGSPTWPEEPLYRLGANPTDDCTEAPTAGSNVCVHWATATADAPEPADQDGDGLPDQVETTRDVLNYVWKRIVDRGGYRAPLADGLSANHGPDDRLDVYLADIGDEGLYGYCASDDPDLEAYAVSVYCVLDEDYAEFSGAPSENLRVTAAHEFFHAVQYAYDSYEDTWLLEGTAAWVEDELYDSVNDNRQYLAEGPLAFPSVPMDYVGDLGDGRAYGPYGSWIFWRYLTERFDAEEGTGLPVIMRQVFDRMGGAAGDPDDHSTLAVSNVLSAHGADLTKVFAQFGVANRRPAASYEEGRAYRPAPLAGTFKMRNSKSQRLTARPFHLSNATARILPGRAHGARSWKLRITAATPPVDLGYAVAVTTHHKNGAVRTRLVRLNPYGAGRITVPFSRKHVRKVEVTLTNASVRYTCWEGTVFACQGVAMDDERPMKVTLRAVR